MVRLFITVFCLLCLTSCLKYVSDVEDTQEQSQIEEMGTVDAQAGENIAGEVSAGQSIAGENTAGEIAAGETIAGETVAGENTAGSSVAGEVVAGENTAGEIMAGMDNPTAALVTFHVDMRCSSAPQDFNTVSVTGDFCNWCDQGFILSDEDLDGIYSGSFNLEFGEYQYLYMIDQFQEQENLQDYSVLGEESCAPITDGRTYANRKLIVNEDTTTNDIYNHCTSCNDRPDPPVFETITFDDEQTYYRVIGFEGVVGEIIQEEGTTIDNRVVRLSKGEDATDIAGAVISTRNDQTVGIVPISDELPWMSIRVYSSYIGTPVRMKLESSTNPEVSVEAEQGTLVADEWETLYFDFSDPFSGSISQDASYDKIILFFDFGLTGQDLGERTYFFDDINYWGERPLDLADCTAESCPFNSIEWVSLPKGEFIMGTDNGVANEVPAHQVKVPSIEVMKSEITIGQYRSCVDAGECDALYEPELGCIWPSVFDGVENHPVNCLSRIDLIIFAEWLSEQHSRYAQARLMTEAEWEYAAKSAGEVDPYPWGINLISCDRAHYLTCSGSGGRSTLPVCSANGLTSQGLCDMLGNVAEWVSDDWPSNYFYTPRDGRAYQAPFSGAGTVRGGHYESPYQSAGPGPGDLSITMHTEFNPMTRDPRHGGRLARFIEADVPFEWISLPNGTWNSMRVFPFSMMKTELTVGQYRSCIKAGFCSPLDNNLSDDCAELAGTQFDGYREHHPVRCLETSDLEQVSEWLATSDPQHNYRIPSVNEWFFASSNASSLERYPWQNGQITCEQANVNLSDTQSDCPLETQEICSLTAGNTTQGLCDMIGNVSEFATGQFNGNTIFKAMGMNFTTIPLSNNNYQVQDLMFNPPPYSHDLGGRLVRIPRIDP